MLRDPGPDAERLTDERVREIAEGGEVEMDAFLCSVEAVTLAREVLAARAGDREEREPDLWWPSDDGEASYPDAGEAAYGIEQETGTIREFDVARTCGKRWVAMLPTDFERDDGWEGGIGWLDGEPESFTTYAAAVQAVEKRKADLLAAPGGETRKEANDG